MYSIQTLPIVPRKWLSFLLKSGGVLLLCIVLGLGIYTQFPQRTAAPLARHPAELVWQWNKLLLELEQHTPGYRPPVAARMHAFTSIAAYQAASPLWQNKIDIPNVLDLQVPTAHIAPQAVPLSINEAYMQMATLFFPTAANATMQTVKTFYTSQKEQLAAGLDTARVQQAVRYGHACAMAVFAAAEQDSLANMAYLYMYDRRYHPSTEAGKWQPLGTIKMPALLPYWGDVQTFVISPQERLAKPPLAYNTAQHTPYYRQALEVYTLSQPMTKEKRWIAEFWGDDVQGLTLSAAGRWVAIATEALRKKHADLQTSLQTYLQLSVALHDAAVACWHSKYYYNVERPQSFINTHIDATWQALHDNPSFPSYPSGHSVFGAAAAAVLTAQLGEHFAMTDATHVNRTEFMGAPRHYESFEAMAIENAYSRMLMGVHFRMDCDEGLRLGKAIGQKVVARFQSPVILSTHHTVPVFGDVVQQ